MKIRALLLFTLILLTAGTVSASTVNQNCKISSKILGRDVKFTIYLPDDYQSDSRSYPVLYLLHGLGDNHMGWSQQGEVKQITDKAVAQGRACNMIIVMPDAAQTWYVNNHDGSVRYEDMFFEELIPYIESNYRAIDQKDFRAIAGLSMGGQGALLYSLHHPDKFAACYAMSSAIYTDDEIKTRGGDFRPLFETIFGKGVATECWTKNSVLGLMENMNDSQKNSVAFFLDCGDDDFLYNGNSNLHIIMRNKNIPHQYRVRDGGHSWSYWRGGLDGVLEFVTKYFRRS